MNNNNENRQRIPEEQLREMFRRIDQAQRINHAAQRARQRRRMWQNTWHQVREQRWDESGRKNK